MRQAAASSGSSREFSPRRLLKREPAPRDQLSGRPLTPLHKGHVGILCTSGLLNGQFGEGKDTHVAYWESVKVVDRIEEEGERADTTVVREKERFSQRLTLLYADGRIELLSERPAPSKKRPAASPPAAHGAAPRRRRPVSTSCPR